MIALLTAAVVPLHKEVQLSLGDLSMFLDTLIAWVLDKADNELKKISALHMLSSIVNRRSNGKWKFLHWFTNYILLTVYADLSSFLNDKLDIFWSKEIQDGTLSIERRVWAIKTWTWVSFILKAMSCPVLTDLAFRVRYPRHYSFRSIH